MNYTISCIDAPSRCLFLPGAAQQSSWPDRNWLHGNWCHPRQYHFRSTWSPLPHGPPPTNQFWLLTRMNLLQQLRTTLKNHEPRLFKWVCLSVRWSVGRSVTLRRRAESRQRAANLVDVVVTGHHFCCWYYCCCWYCRCWWVMRAYVAVCHLYSVLSLMRPLECYIFQWLDSFITIRFPMRSYVAIPAYEDPRKKGQPPVIIWHQSSQKVAKVSFSRERERERERANRCESIVLNILNHFIII